MMDSFKTMDEAWRSYAERVVPFNAPDSQRIECHRAFYAGGQALLHGIIMNILDPSTAPTAADFIKMDNLSAELEKFCVDVVAGRA